MRSKPVMISIAVCVMTSALGGCDAYPSPVTMVNPQTHAMHQCNSHKPDAREASDDIDMCVMEYRSIGYEKK